THRRIVPCRLQPRHERPEERSGWKIPDLPAHVLQHRGELLIAGLTILRAHALAGRPAADLPAMGTYEVWSAVVRQAIFWATGLDPCATRKGTTPDGRGALAPLAAVLEGWSTLPGGTSSRQGVSARQALECARMARSDKPLYPVLREGLEAW